MFNRLLMTAQAFFTLFRSSDNINHNRGQGCFITLNSDCRVNNISEDDHQKCNFEPLIRSQNFDLIS